MSGTTTWPYSVSFVSRVDELNKLPASSVWVFIAQLVKHCRANAEATGLNPVEAPKKFFRTTSQLLKLRFNCYDHIFISFVFRQFTSFHYVSGIIVRGISRTLYIWSLRNNNYLGLPLERSFTFAYHFPLWMNEIHRRKLHKTCKSFV